MKHLGAFCLILAVASSCVEPSSGPGDEVMGNFEFEAALVPPPASDSGVVEEVVRCPYKEFSETLSFSARFARFTRAGGASGGSAEAIITIGGYHRDAGFDGQVLTGRNDPGRPSGRVFTPVEQDCLCQAQVVETLSVALLSSSQNAAAGDECPANALDGGVQKPTADGGIRLPDTTPSGFDAVRACGELVDRVEVDMGSAPEGCNCQPVCVMRYAVKGARR